MTSRRQWVEGHAGLGKEAVEDGQAVLQALEPGADQNFQPVDGGRGEVSEAAFEVGPHALGWVQVRG